MKSLLIRYLGCSALALSLAAAPISTAFAAPDNGGGIVYNKSDCSPNYTRMYAFGGAGGGSSCGYWLDSNAQAEVWSNGDHNWTAGEASEAFRQACNVARIVAEETAEDTGGASLALWAVACIGTY